MSIPDILQYLNVLKLSTSIRYSKQLCGKQSNPRKLFQTDPAHCYVHLGVACRSWDWWEQLYSILIQYSTLLHFMMFQFVRVTRPYIYKNSSPVHLLENSG